MYLRTHSACFTHLPHSYFCLTRTLYFLAARNTTWLLGMAGIRILIEADSGVRRLARIIWAEPHEPTILYDRSVQNAMDDAARFEIVQIINEEKRFMSG